MATTLAKTLKPTPPSVADDPRWARIVARDKTADGHVWYSVATTGASASSDISIEEGRSWAQRPGHFVWIGFHEPNKSELREIQAQFDLHPLAVEDALHAHQRPKLELYGNSLFMVLRTAQLQGDHVAFGETHIFAGPGSSSRSATAPRRRTRRYAFAASPALACCVMARITSSTPSSISWSTTTCPVVEAMENEVAELEDRVLKDQVTRSDVERIYQLRRELLPPAPHGGADDRGVSPPGAPRAAVHRRRHPSSIFAT